MKDIFDTEVQVGDRVAVSRQYGYSVAQYAGTVLEVYYDKSEQPKVRVEYDRQEGGRNYGIPEKPQRVGLDKVVVVASAGTV